MAIVNVLDTETHGIKKLQKKKMHIGNAITSQIPSFTIKDNTLFKIEQDVDKYFKALVVPKSLALTL